MSYPKDAKGARSRVAYLSYLLGRKRPTVEVEEEEANVTMSSSTMIHPPIESTYISLTTETQKATSAEIEQVYHDVPCLQFQAREHLSYAQRKLKSVMPAAYKSLDANHPWMTYWLLNSQRLISPNDTSLNPSDIPQLINDKIERCVNDDGANGIAGGTNQMGHVASSYAAVLTLVLTRNYPLLHKIKPRVYQWMLSLKRGQQHGSSYIMHQHGEHDTRSTYCILVIASLLGVLTEEITAGVEEWILSCQTYEGGFAGVPHTEAHGGYTFCAVAALLILNRDARELKQKLDFDALVRWCSGRMTLEGGFNGRSNKLVDACYSFWIGAVFPMLEVMDPRVRGVFDHEALSNYLLRVAQVDGGTGGFRDKPGKNPDYYHTNYSLCGLSLCEHEYVCPGGEEAGDDDVLAFGIKARENDEGETFTRAVHPVFGVPLEDVAECKRHFANQEG
ncbi:uncharacterized protein LODBEIA_P51800 [Lodderomyces beijingensis]|uniref:Protein farnesyltransferase subunit beta n=1 Tax=Lodderomyces beijingensis TaxID=1775926 RepID=A0ABP0ZV06_9ASCO